MATPAINYDVLVIGAGPAGYVAAIRAAQLGLKTACIDNWNRPSAASANRTFSLGGTYVNSGCIPCIALMESAKIHHLLRHDLAEHGLSVGSIRLDVKRAIRRKDEIVAKLNGQIAELFKYNGVDCIQGRGRLLDPNRIEITSSDGEINILSAEHIVLATGSVPITVPAAIVDNKRILDTEAALNMTEAPKRLGILGAGVIGFELGGIWRRLGSEVILLDAQETFLNSADRQVAAEAYRIFTEQGLDIRLGARVIATQSGENQVSVDYQDRNGTHRLEFDKLIVASGRKPNTENLAAPETGLVLDENGFVHVDEQCMTSLPSVYAIGDLTALGPMLAHKGLEEGIFVAELIAKRPSNINYPVMPSVIYSEPEIAWTGQSEQALRAAGEPIKVGIFPIAATGRAQAVGKREGFVKIIAHAESDCVLGVHIIGIHASELIAEAVLAMEFSASAEDLARTIHAHPTISEALHEAALALANRTLHLPLEDKMPA
ncbi:MAG: dihydrolipoyl dehydrogenase [Gammaproteobacteria bacterium]